MIRIVIGVLKRDDRVLLGLRSSRGSVPNVWEFPGGKVEENESDEQALIREFAEELGIQVVVEERLYQHDFPQEEGCDPFVALTYRVTSTGDPTALIHERLAWYDPIQLHELPVAPSLKRALREGCKH